MKPFAQAVLTCLMRCSNHLPNYICSYSCCLPSDIPAGALEVVRVHAAAALHTVRGAVVLVIYRHDANIGLQALLERRHLWACNRRHDSLCGGKKWLFFFRHCKMSNSDNEWHKKQTIASGRHISAKAVSVCFSYDLRRKETVNHCGLFYFFFCPASLLVTV